MPSRLHDRMHYIDEARAWLSENLDWLRPDIVCAVEEWITLDLAAWREGAPPSPPIEPARLVILFGTSDPAHFFDVREAESQYSA